MRTTVVELKRVGRLPDGSTWIQWPTGMIDKLPNTPYLRKMIRPCYVTRGGEESILPQTAALILKADKWWGD